MPCSTSVLLCPIENQNFSILKKSIICNCQFEQKNLGSSSFENVEKTNLNSPQNFQNDVVFNFSSSFQKNKEKQEKPKFSIFRKLFFFSQQKSDLISGPFKDDEKNFSTAFESQKKKANSLKTFNRQNSVSSGMSGEQKKNSRFSSCGADQSGSNPQRGKGSGWARETQKQQVVSITYEEIGLFPRSFNRVFDRFFKQLFFDVENFVIQEYRFYRYLFLTTVKCLFILLFVPLSVNFLAKNYFIRPITEYFWNTQNHEIFLNSYQQKKAFSEFKNFEEKIYFESFLFSENSLPFDLRKESSLEQKNFHTFPISNLEQNSKTVKEIENTPKSLVNFDFSTNFQNSLQKRLQKKIIELANHYNEESIEAVTNFFADILSFGTLWFLLIRLEIQINITKSFLLEVFFGLDDSKKSLLILFLTDLLVGYHSPNIWELFFQTLFDHYGLPESQTTIFLLVATLPVLLDVLFKYLIFRHLNRASPATVATYHAMIE